MESHTEPWVHVFVYCWNNAEKLQGCLQFLAQTEYGNYKAILLDNGSEDQTGALMEVAKCDGVFPQCDVIHLPVNIGAPTARNWLAALPENRHADFLAYFDDDILVEPDWLTRMVAGPAAESRGWGGGSQNYAAQKMEVPIRYDFFIYVINPVAFGYYSTLPVLEGKSVLAITTGILTDQCKDLGWETAQQLSAQEIAMRMKESVTAILPASSVAIEFLATTQKPPLAKALAKNQNIDFDAFTAAGSFFDAIMDYQSELIAQTKTNSVSYFPLIDFVTWMHA